MDGHAPGAAPEPLQPGPLQDQALRGPAAGIRSGLRPGGPHRGRAGQLARSGDHGPHQPLLSRKRPLRPCAGLCGRSQQRRDGEGPRPCHGRPGGQGRSGTGAGKAPARPQGPVPDGSGRPRTHAGQEPERGPQRRTGTGPFAGPRPAAGRLGRPCRRGGLRGGHGAGHRQAARAGDLPGLRQQPVRRGHLPPRLGGPAHQQALSPAEPRHPERLPARVGLEAAHGRILPGERRGSPRDRLLRRPDQTGQPDLPLLAARRPRQPDAGAVAHQLLRRVLLHHGRAPGHRQDLGLCQAMRLRPPHRGGPAPRTFGPGALARLEAALPQTGLGARRYLQHLHRSGFHPGHAHPDGRLRVGHAQRRRPAQAPAAGRCPPRGARPHPRRAEPPALRGPGHAPHGRGRYGQGGGPPRCRHGRQDRYGPGDQAEDDRQRPPSAYRGAGLPAPRPCLDRDLGQQERQDLCGHRHGGTRRRRFQRGRARGQKSLRISFRAGYRPATGPRKRPSPPAGCWAPPRVPCRA